MDLGLWKANEQRITARGADFYATTNYIYEGGIFLLNFSFNFNQLNKKRSLLKVSSAKRILAIEEDLVMI
jgi:ferric enterobactin receptor